MFDWLMQLFKEAKGSQSNDAPFWRGKGTRMRHARTPFKSSRKRGIAPQRMHVEEFESKQRRDERFQELRAEGTPHVCKYSTVSGENSVIGKNKSIWCVVRP